MRGGTARVRGGTWNPPVVSSGRERGGTGMLLAASRSACWRARTRPVRSFKGGHGTLQGGAWHPEERESGPSQCHVLGGKGGVTLSDRGRRAPVRFSQHLVALVGGRGPGQLVERTPVVVRRHLSGGRI